jgi:hypothetical protein
MYSAVVSAAREIGARRLYRKDVMEGIRDDDDFLHIMFFDACFLVMYMLNYLGMECDKFLSNFFNSSADEFAHDIMLLENQIPWPVVDALLKYTSVPLADFVSIWKWQDGRLQDRVYYKVPAGDVVLDETYGPPHLFGLLRFYIVGRSRTKVPGGVEKMKSAAVSLVPWSLPKWASISEPTKQMSLLTWASLRNRSSSRCSPWRRCL